MRSNIKNTNQHALGIAITMIHTEHKLKKDLQTWVLPVVLNVRKVARGNKHFVAYFLAALFPFCPRCLYTCPKALKSYFSTGLFAIFIHPVTFYCSPFSLDMSIQFLLCTKIIHNQTLAIIRLSEYNYTDNV